MTEPESTPTYEPQREKLTARQVAQTSVKLRRSAEKVEKTRTAMDEAIAVRDREIIAAVSSGFTYRQAAGAARVTYPRVQQILAAYREALEEKVRDRASGA